MFCDRVLFFKVKQQINGTTVSLHSHCFLHALGPPKINTRQVFSVTIPCKCSHLNATSDGTMYHSGWVQMWLGEQG